MNKRIWGRFGLSGVIEFLLRVMFFSGIAITLTLPLTLKRLLPHLYFGPIGVGFYRQVLAFMMAFGVLMVLFVFFAARVFRTINRGDPFISENIRSLGVMAALSVGLSATCGWYALSGASILALVLTLFFLFFAGFLMVLRELFKSAIAFKEENEFTI